MTGNVEEYLTRAQFAEKVGISIGEVRRRELVGTLQPTKRVGKKNQPFYAPSLVEEQRSITTKSPAAARTMGASYSGAEAAKVFKELAKNAPLEEIVITTETHPAVVMAIAADWARIRGCLFVSGTVKAEIDALPLDGVFPLTNDRDLLDVLKRCAEDTCATCKKRPRGQSCAGCAAKAARRMESEDV